MFKISKHKKSVSLEFVINDKTKIRRYRYETDSRKYRELI